jgi:hypothetical protein
MHTTQQRKDKGSLEMSSMSHDAFKFFKAPLPFAFSTCILIINEQYFA